MWSNALVRLLVPTVGVVTVAGGCGAFENPESPWSADEESIAERRAADERASAGQALVARVSGLGSLPVPVAECVLTTLVESRGETAASVVLDPETDASRLVRPLGAAVRDCGAGDDLADRWIPELAVELAAQAEPLDCVADAAADWAADRFAEILVQGGLDPDEAVVDDGWLGRLVDRCDAGAAMMAADATLRPRVGADARTPSRWLCAAADAPAGAFDALLDPAVNGDDARLETVERRIARWFDDCP